MEKFHGTNLIAMAVLVGVVVLGTGKAEAADADLRGGSLSADLLKGTERGDLGQKSLSRFQLPSEMPAVGKIQSFDGGVQKSSFTDVTESFWTFAGSLGSFLGNCLSWVLQKKLLVPGIFLCMGIHSLIRK